VPRGPDEAAALAFLPPRLRRVPYVYARHPGNTAPGDVSGGANCQLYAYAVLRHFGHHVPPVRSSDLWADHTAMRTVTDLLPLDLLLFDPGPRPEKPGRAEGYAAHIAVHLGPDRILHLCQEIGLPTLWTRADFAARPRYARLLGAKRALRAIDTPPPVAGPR
jgi:hypothetical protein